MPFDVPNLPTLAARVQADLAIDPLRQSDAVVLARTLAGSVYGLYGYLQWIADQVLPDTADAETLEREALLRLSAPRLAANAAAGLATFNAVAGAVLDAGVLLQAADGRQYQLAAELTTVAGGNTATIKAVIPGAIGNAAAALELSLVSPVLGVSDVFKVTQDGITGGTDQEGIEALRQRVIRSYRVIPHGGQADDYVTWALEVPGFTRAWTVRNYMGPGTVGVFAVRDDDPDIEPSPIELAALHAHLDSRRPVTAEVYALAPTLVPVVYGVTVTPDTSAVRAAVESALTDLHAREADLGGGLLLSHIRAAISGATGENDYLLTTPAADIPAAANELLTFGGCVWA